MQEELILVVILCWKRQILTKLYASLETLWSKTTTANIMLTWFEWIVPCYSVGLDPTRSWSICMTLHRLPVLLALSLKAQNAREACAQQDRRQTGRSNVSVFLSYEFDVASRHCVTQHRPSVNWTRDLLDRATVHVLSSLSLFNDLGAFHSSLALYFISVQTAEEKSPAGGAPINLKDLTNAIWQRFILELTLNGF